MLNDKIHLRSKQHQFPKVTNSKYVQSAYNIFEYLCQEKKKEK